MGWYYSQGASRKDIIREQLTLGENHTVLRHCTRGNTLWAVIETKPADHAPGYRWIYCGLMQVDHSCGWGYKPLDESMGPVQVTCPLGYLKLCTSPVNAYARDWRIKVREYHAAQAEKRKARKDQQAARKYFNDHVVFVRG